MSETEPGAIERVIASLREGGLPAIIAGPAGEAISRLIGGAADVPAAWLEQQAQRIRDKTAARSEAWKRIGPAAGAAVVEDPQRLERGIEALLGKAYRAQGNREGVAAETIRILAEEPAGSEGSMPGEDWFNIFEAHAEKASSERMKQTWGRVLAGEIRKKGSFSLQTIQFISLLDQHTAELVQEMAGRTFHDRFVSNLNQTGSSIIKSSHLSSLGFLVESKSWTPSFDEHGRTYMDFASKIIVLHGEPHRKINYSIHLLTRIGQEIIPIARPEITDAYLAEMCRQIFQSIPAVQRATIAHVTTRSSDTFNFEEIEDIERPS